MLIETTAQGIKNYGSREVTSKPFYNCDRENIKKFKPLSHLTASQRALGLLGW